MNPNPVYRYSSAFDESFDKNMKERSGKKIYEKNDLDSIMIFFAGCFVYGLPKMISLDVLFDENNQLLADNVLTLEMQVRDFFQPFLQAMSTFSSFSSN